MFAGVMTGLEELRQYMTKRIDRERGQQGHQRLRELADAKSQARSDQAHLIRNTDQGLAESWAVATKQSEEKDIRMTREIERLLNDHDNMYAHTMTILEKRLDTKTDLVMRKFDEILSGSNRENRPAPMEDSREATDGSGAHIYAEVQPRSRAIKGSPVEGGLDNCGPARSGCFIRSMLTDNAASQISTRSRRTLKKPKSYKDKSGKSEMDRGDEVTL